MTSIRTSKADRNYLSLNADSVVWFAGTPDEKPGVVPYPVNLLPESPGDWDSILKFSGRADTQLMGIKVGQGNENSLDINNVSHDLILEGSFGVGEGIGDQVMTIKGGSHHIAIKGVIENRGRKSEIEIGQWSDQSPETTHHIDLSLLRHVDGEPLTIILGRVNSPLRSILLGNSPDIALPPNSRIKVWASLGLLTYWWLKRLYVLFRYRRW